MIKPICMFVAGLFSNFVFSQQSISEDPLQTSIVNLITSPDKFENKRVIMKGFLSLGKENYSLYLTKDDLIYRNTKNSILLLLTEDIIGNLYKENLKDKYVVILGSTIPKIEVFKKAYSNYGGVLKNIENVQEIEAQ